MKRNPLIIMSLVGACMAFMVSCSAGKAKDAFKNGTLAAGSTYEEMVAAIGEPTKEKQAKEGVLATYSTIVTNSHMFILIEKNEDGQLVITDYTDNAINAISYSKKLGL